MVCWTFFYHWTYKKMSLLPCMNWPYSSRHVKKKNEKTKKKIYGEAHQMIVCVMKKSFSTSCYFLRCSVRKPLSFATPFHFDKLNDDDASNSNGFTLEFLIKSIEFSASRNLIPNSITFPISTTTFFFSSSHNLFPFIKFLISFASPTRNGNHSRG